MTIPIRQVLFVGGVYGKQFLENNPNIVGRRLQAASDRFQKAFLNGLDLQERLKVQVIASPFIGSFPNGYRSPIVRGFKEKFGRSVTLRSVWTLNLPVLKLFSIFISLLVGIGRERRLVTAPRIAFVYSVNLPYLAAALCARMMFGGLRVVPIITDLPIYPGDSSRLYRWYLGQIEWPLVRQLLRWADDYVVLTTEMPSKLGLAASRCIVMEGIYSPTKVSALHERVPRIPRSVVYTGSLDTRYGVKELVAAFLTLDKSSYQLTVYGDGPLKSYIEGLPHDAAVRYGGVLGANEVAAVQSAANLLINPRTNDGEYNKYSFPSKLIEYLASGAPVLCYRLDGVPHEYFDYLHLIMDEVGESIAEAVQRVFAIEESKLLGRAMRGREFILEHKSDGAQIARVLDFLDQCSS